MPHRYTRINDHDHAILRRWQPSSRTEAVHRDALRACSDALKHDAKLGKALLRAAHVHMMIGETAQARRYYRDAIASGAATEGSAGLKGCQDADTELQRLGSELGCCRRAGCSFCPGDKLWVPSPLPANIPPHPQTKPINPN